MTKINFARRLSKSAAALACTAAVSAAMTVPAFGGTLTTWKGTGTSGNWTTTNSWSNTPTTAGTWSLVYGGAPTYTTGTVNTGVNPSTVSIDSINFTNDGSAGNAVSFTIRNAIGRTLTLVNGATITTTAASSPLTDIINSNAVITGTTNFNLGANHNINFNATSVAGSSKFVKSGDGALNLGSAVSLTGLRVDGGMVRLNGNSAAASVSGLTVDVGSGVATGTLSFNVLASATTTDANIRMGGDAAVSADGNSSVTFSNSQFNVYNGSVGAALLGLGGSGTGTGARQTVSGAIVDNAGATSLAVTGNNLWVLNGANTYTGSSSVAAVSKLLLNGSVASAASSIVSGFVGGTGSFTGPVTVSGNSGVISPGGVANDNGTVTPSIGVLSVGSLQLSGTGSKSVFSVTGTTPGIGFDRITGLGGVSFGGILDLAMSGTQTYALNTTFNLFNFGSYTAGLSKISFNGAGTPYSGLNFAQSGTAGIWMTNATSDPMGYRLQFNENTGNLVVVPEPSSIVIAGLGVAMAGWQVVRRRRQPKTVEA